MTGSITRYRDIESFKAAARSPARPGHHSHLATRLAAARVDAEGYRYFASWPAPSQARRCRSRSPGFSRHG